VNTPTAAPGAAAFTHAVRVYWEDTDAGGVVFYANYLKFFERARTEWLRACGVDQRQLADDTGAIFIVRSTSLDYRAPARLDDTLTITSRPGRIGRASVDFTQEAWCGDTLLVAGHIRLGCVDRNDIRPAAIPPAVLDALQRGPVIDAGHTSLSTKLA
jgi:acyl-CoA thioester hydrolase